jgi:hypothetical protein
MFTSAHQTKIKKGKRGLAAFSVAFLNYFRGHSVCVNLALVAKGLPIRRQLIFRDEAMVYCRRFTWLSSPLMHSLLGSKTIKGSTLSSLKIADIHYCVRRTPPDTLDPLV